MVVSETTVKISPFVREMIISAINKDANKADADIKAAIESGLFDDQSTDHLTFERSQSEVNHLVMEEEFVNLDSDGLLAHAVWELTCRADRFISGSGESSLGDILSAATVIKKIILATDK